MTPRYGIYRGTVENNLDPKRKGRVQVKVPALGDGGMTWAQACSPYAGDGVGLVTVPPKGAQVWVGFEGGDPDQAVLLGCFWNGEAPGDGLPAKKVLKTDAVTVTVDDTPGGGGLTVEVGPPAVQVAIKVACTSSGLELSMGSSKLVLSASSVSINDGALEVT
jgi:hypothetical protein